MFISELFNQFKEDDWHGQNPAWHSGTSGSWHDGKDQWHDETLGETVNMSDIITARELIGQAVRDPKQEKHRYFEFLKNLRKKYGADYSTHVHQQAAKLAQAKDSN